MTALHVLPTSAKRQVREKRALTHVMTGKTTRKSNHVYNNDKRGGLNLGGV